jgi:hypothetical protein
MWVDLLVYPVRNRVAVPVMLREDPGRDEGQQGGSRFTIARQRRTPWQKPSSGFCTTSRGNTPVPFRWAMLWADVPESSLYTLAKLSLVAAVLGSQRPPYLGQCYSLTIENIHLATEWLEIEILVLGSANVLD